MKRRIFLVIGLVLSFILSGFIESYAAEARAYASVLIIIPPREEEKNTDDAKNLEEVNLAQNQAESSEESGKDE